MKISTVKLITSTTNKPKIKMERTAAVLHSIYNNENNHKTKYIHLTLYDF